MRRSTTLILTLCLWSGASPVQAQPVSKGVLFVQERQHDLRVERKQDRLEQRSVVRYHRKTSDAGTVDTSTFRKTLPERYRTELLRYRGMILSAPALKAYYEACGDVGHYIGGAGYRSHTVQHGMSSSLAAPAGYSYHEVGLALDVFGLSPEEQGALLEVGFNQLPSEAWHYSYKVSG